MIIEHDTPEVTLGNVTKTGMFKIRQSAHAFKILSSSLYSNKIKAVIRELSANAVDSHVAAGKSTTPFEVHLPTRLEPWFAVRDFGIGLSGEQVLDIYTTYFSSTKTDSNDFIGGLGLGSKSPFAYSDNFTVTAIQSGVKRIYSAFINGDGEPSIAEMHCELSDEPQGVEVKLSVVNSYDYHSFTSEAQSVFKWFKLKPIITGQTLEIFDVTYAEKDIIPGVHRLTTVSSHSINSVAVMGNIAYPLNKLSDPEDHFGNNLAKLLHCNLVLDFDIGQLDFAASREELSFIPSTIAHIKEKLDALNSTLVTHLTEKADKITNLWERADFLYTQTRDSMYQAAVPVYVANTKFPLFDTSSFQGRHQLFFSDKDMTAAGLAVTRFSPGSGTSAYSGSMARTYRVINGVREDGIVIPVDASSTFVLNDTKIGCTARARHHYKGDRNIVVYCITHKSADNAERQVAYDAFMALLFSPPNVVMASSLSKPVKATTTVSSTGILTASFRPGGYYYGRYERQKLVWTQVPTALPATSTYYYVALTGFEVNDDIIEKTISLEHTSGAMAASKIPGISDITIYGVRKSRIAEIEKLQNWVKLTDKLKEETAKLSESHIESIIIGSYIGGQYDTILCDSKIAALLPLTSFYAKTVNEYSKFKAVDTAQTDKLVQLCSKFGKAVHTSTCHAKAESLKTTLYAKYPMLKFISSSVYDKAKVAEYINLVDSQ